ncbi:DUF1573 domain-containing protein [Candidatus Bipolaricaulota bacterium]|nr:DUF1573 domain-containing protein [Candidatus Bipolaricaulota bacterium]
MKRSATVILGLLVLSTVALAAPQLVVSPTLYDFGTAMDGAVIEFAVVLTNQGDATLQISGVSYNCSCTSYQLPKRTLAAGESVVMKVTFRTAGYSRYPQPVSQVLTVSSNDPANPRQVIEVRGYVRQLAAHEGAATTLDRGFYVLVDLRSPEDYARGHLLGAMNIPFAELQARLGELPRSKVIYFYDATGIEAVQAVQLLQQNGFLIARAVSGGLAGWWLALGDLFFVWAPDAERTVATGTPYYGTFSAVAPTRLAQEFQYVVDLRSPEAYAQGRFPGADNVSLPTAEDVAAWAATLPRPRPGTSLTIWIVDEDGSVACSVAQYLQSVGFSQARCLFGGIAAWRAQFGDELLFPVP